MSNNSLLIERKVHLKLNNKNSNINVCIESDDSYIYTVSVATTKNFLQRINKKGNFSNPSELVIVVRKLTQEIITEIFEIYA